MFLYIVGFFIVMGILFVFIVCVFGKCNLVMILFIGIVVVFVVWVIFVKFLMLYLLFGLFEYLFFLGG